MPGNRKAREDLDAKSSKLAEMEADYGDVVPRRDFERLEAQFTVSNVNLPAKSLHWKSGVIWNTTREGGPP